MGGEHQEENPSHQEKLINHFMRQFFDITTLSVLLSIYVVFKFIKAEMYLFLNCIRMSIWKF